MRTIKITAAVYPEHRQPQRQPAAQAPATIESLYLRIGTDVGVEGSSGRLSPTPRGR